MKNRVYCAFLLLLVGSVIAADVDSVELEKESEKSTAQAEMEYWQPVAFLGYNDVWGVTAEGGLIVGKRHNGTIIGGSVSYAYTDAGDKYAFGIASGFYALGGGMGSLRLQYAILRGAKNKSEIRDRTDYRGVELCASMAGPGGGFGATLSYFRNENDSNDNFVSFGVGVGF